MTGKTQNHILGTRCRAIGSVLAIALALGVLATASVQAQTYKILHTFTGGTDGASPYAPLIHDGAGNLYGTTFGGGLSGAGTVFKIDTLGKETVLYNFTGGADGSNPYGGVIQDMAGNLYGTTFVGGGPDAGVVFKIDTVGQESVLYNFTGKTDGGYPRAGLVQDAEGNLYGSTEGGGFSFCACGVVFKLDTSGNETVLARFTNQDYGQYPYAGLIHDAAGNLYGTASSGGLLSCQCGTAFKIPKTGKGTVLHSFAGIVDGETPYGPVILDSRGNIYGTTWGGGLVGDGTVFKIDASGKETVLYSFRGFNTDGANPVGGLVSDSVGNLYGTTNEGGKEGAGTVFELNRDGTETILYAFQNEADGSGPEAGLLRDAAGNLYGTTKSAGDITCNEPFGCGVVFEITP